MAKSHGRRSRMRSRRNKMRGGSYSSAATYGAYVNGSGDSQYARVFDSNGSYGNIQSNSIIGTSGQGLQSTQIPTSNQLALIQKAGGRRRKKGGFLGNVVNQAVVPMALFGLQQTYGRKMNRVRNTHKHRTRRHRRH